MARVDPAPISLHGPAPLSLHRPGPTPTLHSFLGSAPFSLPLPLSFAVNAAGPCKRRPPGQKASGGER
ncbi:hypothetical protein NL676_033712 [Syzygium grande]|nr:hypothetical protein NL676_033712 [Syzygium grande]